MSVPPRRSPSRRRMRDEHTGAALRGPAPLGRAGSIHDAERSVPTVTSPVSSRHVNPWTVLVVLSLGLFMTLLDLTIVNIAIPSLVDGIHASLDQVLWVLNAYSLAYAVLLITSGRLGDVLGPRTLFLAGLVLFVIASAGSGLAQNPAAPIACRA